MMQSLRGTGKVLSFTYRQHTQTRGFRVLTILLALLFLCLTPGIMGLVEKTDMNASMSEIVDQSNPIAKVIIIDETGEAPIDWSFLSQQGAGAYDDILYETAATLDAVGEVEAATLLLRIEKREGAYTARVLRGESSGLTSNDAEQYAQFVMSCFTHAIRQWAGLDETTLAALNAPVAYRFPAFPVEEIESYASAEAIESLQNAVLQAFSSLLPYLTVLLLYFLILAYGQGVANSAIMEKSSKLMDTFLVSIRPSAMIMGKVLGMAFVALTQLTIWILSIWGGFAAGVALVRAIHPDSTMGLVLFLENIGDIVGFFSPAAIGLSVLIIIGGFLMFCALSGLGGALASKPEDLSSTNILFTLALVTGFLVAFYSSVLPSTNGVVNPLPWYMYIPFMAIFVFPSRLLVGEATFLEGGIALGLILLFTVIFVIIAGKLYTAMAFWKGNVPKPKDILRLLRKDKR